MKKANRSVEVNKNGKAIRFEITAERGILEQGDRSHKSIPDDYAWHNGGLYHRGGDTLLPHHSGNWAWLENCDESEAAERAAEWEAQK